jgi:hypothetical protein
MEKTVKLICRANAGKKVNFVNFNLVVAYNEVGECEVDEKIAEELIKKYPWNFDEPYPEFSKATQVDLSKTFIPPVEILVPVETVEENPAVESITEVVAESEQPEISQVETQEEAKKVEEPVSITDMTAKELKELAEKSGLPKQEWKTMGKVELVDYITKKING